MNAEIGIEPGWKPVAFKEWALVGAALASGGQDLLLRKGGIAEGRYGFEWKHDRFFLFPTWFHAQAEQVRDPMPLDPPEEGKITLSLLLKTVDCGVLTDWDDIARLAPRHVWRKEIVRERYEWGDRPGISWAAVEVWALARPWVLDDRRSFGGCRSWIDLPEDEWSPALLDGAEKVAFRRVGE